MGGGRGGAEKGEKGESTDLIRVRVGGQGKGGKGTEERKRGEDASPFSCFLPLRIGGPRKKKKKEKLEKRARPPSLRCPSSILLYLSHLHPKREGKEGPF